MAEEKMVPFSQAVRMLTTGFEWEAGLFVETYRELKARYGQDVAKEVLGRGMYRAGLRLGKEARALAGSLDPKGMAQAWDVLYGMGTQEAERVDGERFIIRGQGCAALNLMRRWGLSDDEIRFLSDAYCSGDLGHAEGFNEQMYFQHTTRLARSDDYCTWDFSTTPLEPSPSAVQVTGLKDE